MVLFNLLLRFKTLLLVQDQLIAYPLQLQVLSRVLQPRSQL
jgi:hypothetical protein